MQHEILERKPLLDEKGCLTEPGFAKSLILDYNRDAIKAPKMRIKEWDYYCVCNDRYGIALTIADNSYMGLDSITLLDFTKPWEHTASPMEFFTGGSVGFPHSSLSGDVIHSGKSHFISFENKGNSRLLKFHMDNFYKHKPINGELLLSETGTESMVIATPFAGKPTYFYYNQKINCLRAKGHIRFDNTEYIFSPEEAFGVLDWGRGVWTYKNTWYWGSGSGLVDDIPFGFNIGYGFGDTTAASENMIFYNGKAHKLDQVKFNIPISDSGKEDYMKPWTFTSNDGRFEMDFLPIIDRCSDSNVGLIRSDQHQIFGRFTGKAILDDGRIIECRDLLGFAEKVYNKW